MKNIPSGLLLPLSPFAGVMVAKPVNLDVPNGAEHVYQQRFAQRNPNSIDREAPARKIRQVEPFPVNNRLSMFIKPVIQGPTFCFTRD